MGGPGATGAVHCCELVRMHSRGVGWVGAGCWVGGAAVARNHPRRSNRRASVGGAHLVADLLRLSAGRPGRPGGGQRVDAWAALLGAALREGGGGRQLRAGDGARGAAQPACRPASALPKPLTARSGSPAFRFLPPRPCCLFILCPSRVLFERGGQQLCLTAGGGQAECDWAQPAGRASEGPPGLSGVPAASLAPSVCSSVSAPDALGHDC
jgi:hypothetical protein